MTYYSPAQMYAQLIDDGDKNKSSTTTTAQKNNKADQRMITLHEYGEACSQPDRIRCVLLCSHTKVIIFIIYTKTYSYNDVIVTVMGIYN